MKHEIKDEKGKEIGVDEAQELLGRVNMFVTNKFIQEEGLSEELQVYALNFDYKAYFPEGLKSVQYLEDRRKKSEREHMIRAKIKYTISNYNIGQHSEEDKREEV